MSIVEKISEAPRRIVQTLIEHGHEAYIVGGAVRDILLGVEPKDYDITTSASPEEVRTVFGRRRCRIIGRRFRLAHVIIHDEIYEVSTFRRKPDENERRTRGTDDGTMIWNDNVFGTMEEDAARRDFTVNALYLDVVGQRGIIDYVGGLKDLKKGIVRAIGAPDERIDEDPVRMVRALKLMANFNFKLERKLDKAIRTHAEKLALASRSRLFEELLKVLSGHQILPQLEAFHSYGVLQTFWPVLDQCWDEREGVLARKLLACADARKAAGTFPVSRSLVLALIAMPFLMSALNPGNMAGFWRGTTENRKLAARAIRVLFESYQVPQLFVEEMISICFLVPRLLVTTLPRGIHANLDYRHGKLLAQLLFEAMNWDADRLKNLP